MNKKLLSICSVLLLSLTLAGCGNNDEPVEETSSNVSSSDTSSTPGETSVVIPEGMVAVRFSYNFENDKTYLVVPATPGTKVSSPSTPRRMGYVFSRWYEDPYCMKAFDFNNTVVPDEGLNIYAGWTAFAADPLGEGAEEDPYVAKTYQITYKSGIGFSYINPDGTLIKSADDGDEIKFKLAIGNNYEGTPEVKANGTILQIQNDLYSYIVHSNTTFEVSGLTEKEVEIGKSGWYICGEGSLWGSDGWDIGGGVSLTINPNNPNDKGMYLGIKFQVNDTFKVTDGSTWFGWEGVNKESPVIDNFRGVSDGYSGENIQCAVAGTYDIYVNEWGQFWIEASK